MKTKLIKKTKTPLLTIAIPTYKRPKLLYLSLISALNQSNKISYEIIVIDNCNDEKINKKVDQIIKDLSHKGKIKFFRNHKNLGMFGNWNQCLINAKGEYITILNDDDLLDHNFVENVVKDINGSKMLIYDNELIGETKVEKQLGEKVRSFLKRFQLVQKEKIYLSDLIFRNPSNGSLGVVVKRNSAILIGGYKSEFYPCADYNFNLNYISKYGGFKIRKKLCKYRISVNESLNKECLVDFVIRDFQLRERIYLKSFKKRKFILSIAEKINFLQACSQCSRYIFLRKLCYLDFENLSLGKFNSHKSNLIKLLSFSKYVCLMIELLILINWKILFFLKKIEWSYLF